MDLATTCSLEAADKRMSWPAYKDLGPVDDPELSEFVCLILFMKKYDCGPTLKMFASNMVTLLCHGKISVAGAFSLGAIANSSDLCVTSVRLKAERGLRLNTGLVSDQVLKLADPKYFRALEGAEWHGLPGNVMELLRALHRWDDTPCSIDRVFPFEDDFRP